MGRRRGDDRWHVPDDRDRSTDVVAMLREVGRAHDGGAGRRTRSTRWRRRARGSTHEPPTLAWICFHVLQEYARHAGHLDVAVELAGGDVGE